MTTRYSRGKIYKLVNSVDDKIYVGSTCLSLSKRFYEHKKQARHKPLPAHIHLNTIGWDNVRIILIENVIAETKDQLLQREQHYIDLLNPSLNKLSAYVHCPHGRRHYQCKECGGASICEHNREKSQCKECGGSQICEHNKRKSSCKECGGASICEHNREKSKCKECGGSQICEHNKRKSQCKECSGASICTHNKFKSSCRECNGDKYYCYECEKSFCNQQNLTYHNNSERHKDTYDRLMKEVFEDD